MEDCIKQLKLELANAKDIQSALDIKKAWNKQYLDPIKDSLNKSGVEEKQELGKKFNLLKRAGDEVFQDYKDALLNNAGTDVNDSKFVFPNSNLESRSFNPLSDVRSELIKLFNSLGFSIETGNEIVKAEENFEYLKVPDDHPSRSETETFYMDGDKSRILRPHCTVHSVRRLREEGTKGSDTVKVVTLGSVYRRDDETPRHTHQFSQMDFIWLQKDLTVSNLRYLLELISKSLFGMNKRSRLRNSYFPFTQPSVELDIECNCKCQHDCDICSGSGWIEIMGAGIFRKEIVNDAGYSDEYICLAGGLGLERVALIKYGISDVRYLYSGNFDFLKDS